MQTNSKGKFYLIPLLIFIALVALLGIGLTLNPKELPSALINKPAPDFTLPLLNRELSSELKSSELEGDRLEDSKLTFSPSDYLGQRWILNVWASWCPSCRYEHPIFNELASKTSIPLVGLNYKDQPADAIQWLAERGNPYSKIPSDLHGDIGIEWGVYGAPETFVIDEKGHIIYRHSGPIDATLFQQEIAPLFPEFFSSAATATTAN